MATTLTPKTALAALAAIGLLLPFGAPLPGSCLRTIGVAGAAPSPSCSGDLRECLRASADMHQTTFGGRYVTADDVARCMEAFNACISGGASKGENASPPKSTVAGGNERKGLPRHFRLRESNGVISDCRVNGNAVTCTSSLEAIPDGMDSFSGSITGQLSGFQVNGTFGSSAKGHGLDDPGCLWETEDSGPITLIFSADGTVTVERGEFQRRFSSCTNSDSSTNPGQDSTGTWSSVE